MRTLTERGTSQFMTVKEAAEYYGVSEKTIRLWIDTGKISAYQPAGRKGRILIERAR